ncbi:hypothetical protein SBF1_3810003 [Candidatus Desulfosporosinus infrequens]|uniref:Uncharacterized protein n=1 Tax=Candidatus Desulfosporosinus infrequens TaxID=2043169 RepID=A0A2U3L5V6_9FIRM|nr:hypothetical protein SBF1_3810003 [Candidatus Desulfosporosinus infrequens]
MYVFHDSQGFVQTIALASAPIAGYASPFPGLTELFLEDTQYADVAQEPLMYKVIDSVPVKQAQPFVIPVVTPPPATEERLTAVEAAIAALMGV